MQNIFKRLFNTMLTFGRKSNMEKEIYEQPNIICELIQKYIRKNNHIEIDLPEDIKRIALIASGSSYHSATIAANFIRNNAHMDAQSYYASEIAVLNSFDVDCETLYIFISQSGETSDTNNALQKINFKTEKTLCITNTKNSSLYNNCEYKVLTYAGPEKSIASTKAMCAQMFCLFLIALKLMSKKEINIADYIEQMYETPDYISESLKKRDEMKIYSKILAKYENAAILASGMFYPLAKEGALKIKETSYINTTAYPTGEFLHGHIAILNKHCAVISFINNSNADFTMNVLNKINSEYKTDSLVISAIPINTQKNQVVYISTKYEIDFMFSTLILMQLLACETAQILGRNVDKPDGLTKIVK